MENLKEFIKRIANGMNKVMHIHIYICMYPLISFVLQNYFGIKLPFNTLAEDFDDLLFGAIYLSLVGLSIPTYLWWILSFCFKNIHPIITIIYFILFLLTGILCFVGAFIVIAYGMR